MRIMQEFRWNKLKEFLLYHHDVLAGCDCGAVGDAKNMRVDGHGRLSEGNVQNDIGSFPAYSRQLFERFARFRNLPAMLVDKQTARSDNILGLHAVKADAFDVLL